MCLNEQGDHMRCSLAGGCKYLPRSGRKVQSVKIAFNPWTNKLGIYYVSQNCYF